MTAVRQPVMPCIDMQATGRNIETLRRKNHLKVTDVQNFFDFNTPQAVYKWERGASLPTVDNLFGLASLFGCAIEDIVILRERIP